MRYKVCVASKQRARCALIAKCKQMYKLQHTVTANTQAQAQAMLAQMQTVFTQYKLKIVLQSNNYYAITLKRKFNSYNKAVKHFNKTVQQFCNIAAQHVDNEDHVPSCYVINAEGDAVY
jgi:hypothetical protein